jgi:hypothetical protein
VSVALAMRGVLDAAPGLDERVGPDALVSVGADTDFQRLAPVRGGRLGGLREQGQAWDIERRRPPSRCCG